MTTKINCSTLKVRKWSCKIEKREGKGVFSFFFSGVWIDRKVSNHTSPFPYTLSLILTAFRSCSLIRMLSISGLIFTFNPHTLYTKWKYTASSSPIQSTWNIVSDILSFKTCYNCPEIWRTCTSNSSENRVRKHRRKMYFQFLYIAGTSNPRPVYTKHYSIWLSETYHFFPKGSRQQVNPWALVVEPHYHTILDVKSALCCESYSSAHYMLPFTFHQLLKDNKVSALQVFSLCKHAEQLNND